MDLFTEKQPQNLLQAVLLWNISMLSTVQEEKKKE